MINVLNTYDLTPKLLSQLLKEAKTAQACVRGLIPFEEAFNRGDYIEARAIVNGELEWLIKTEIISPLFKRTGLCHRYHPNGALWMSCEYIDGKIHGRFLCWYDNGRVKTDCLYLDGQLHGFYEDWHPNGNNHSHCIYNNGKILGDVFIRHADA